MNEKLVVGLAGLATVGVMGIYQEASACGVGHEEFMVTADSLNVRSGAGTNYSVIGSVKKGQKFIPFESGQNGAWGKIKLSNGRTGWVSMQYMKSIDTCNTQTPEQNWTGVVTASSLNVRYDAGTKYSVKTSLPKGTEVEVKYEINGWYKIEYKKGGRYDFGYVSKQYISKKSTTSSNNTSNNTSNSISNSQASEQNWAGIVTANSLNVRTEAGTNNAVKTSLPKGTEVQVHSEKNGWYYIEYKKNGKYDFGYVSKQYVTKKSQTSSNNTQSQQPSYEYKVEGEVYDEETGALMWIERTVYAPASTPLNIRKHPTTQSDIVTKVPRYSKIFISGSHGAWYRVQGVDSQGKSYDGWAHSDYIF